MTSLDYTDRQDFEDADRGFVGTLDDPVIKAADGHVVWDCSKYDFIAGDAPATANPSLWRQGKLVAKHGLYELTPGAYQVRGLDLSNMSLIETDSWRHRHRPVDGERDRSSGAGPLPQASR